MMKERIELFWWHYVGILFVVGFAAQGYLFSSLVFLVLLTAIAYLVENYPPKEEKE